MKKNTNQWSFKRYFFIFLGIVVICFLSDLYNKSEESIGIIGGADGPTAIFLAESSGTSRAGFFGIILLIVLVIYFSFKKWVKK